MTMQNLYKPLVINNTSYAKSVKSCAQKILRQAALAICGHGAAKQVGLVPACGKTLKCDFAF